MTKKYNKFIKILIAISILFWINSGWMIYSNNQQNSFEKTIDTHKELVYNKETEINNLRTDIDEKQKEIDALKEERAVAESNRGTRRYRTATVKTTSYTAGDGYTPGTTMANGQQVYEGAVAYNDAPLNSKIEIDGKIYTVCDRVGSDGVIDIYKDSYQEAINYGVQYKEVKILS